MRILFFLIFLCLCPNVFADFNSGDYFGKGIVIQASGTTVTGGGRILNFASGTTVTVNGNPPSYVIQATAVPTPSYWTLSGSTLSPSNSSYVVSTLYFQLTNSPTNGYVLTSDGSGNGTWQAAQSYWTYNSGTGALYNNVGSWVGIGVTNPGFQLEVNGEAAFDNGFIASALSEFGADFRTVDDNFHYQYALESLGLQESSPQATLHAVSAFPQTLTTPATPNGTTNNESLIGSPSGDSVARTSSFTVGSQYGSAYQNTGSGSYTASGNTYNYTAINYYYSGGIYYYSPVQTQASFSDDSSGNPFTSVFSYSGTYNGGNYTGTVLGLQINGGAWQYYDAGAIGNGTTIYDDGSGSPYNWGSSAWPSGQTQSPDFVANGTPYNFNCYGVGTSPSGHSYYISGDTPSFSDYNDGQPYQMDLYNPNGNSVEFITSSFGNYFINATASGYTILNTNNTGSGYTSPSSYGYASDGTGSTPNYYAILAKTVSGISYYSPISSYSSPNYDSASNNWYSSITWSAVPNATDYILIYSNNGSSQTQYIDFNSTPTSYNDDALSVWTSGAHATTPSSYLPPAGEFDRNTSQSDYNANFGNLIIKSTNSSTPSPAIDFVDNTNTVVGTVGYSHSQGLQLTNSTNTTVEGNSQAEIYAVNPLVFMTFNSSGISFQSGAGYPFSGFGGYTDNFHLTGTGGFFFGASPSGTHVAGGPLTVDHKINIGSNDQSTVSCSTSGNVTFGEPFQGAGKREIIACASACLGTASYTYPTAFTNTPYALGTISAQFTSISTSATTVTGSTLTGCGSLEGF